MKRRDFLKHSGLASTAFFAPSFLTGMNSLQLEKSRSGKILVVIQLSGGNDGLNTVVPFRNDLYYQARPSLAIPSREVLDLNGELGLNPATAGLRDLYEEGLVSIINNVGYPNPDRSHFRSMDIWHTASGSQEYLTSGWLGRYLDSSCSGCASPHHALELDDSLSLALKGVDRNGFAMLDPQRLQKTTQNRFLQYAAKNHSDEHQHEEIDYLYKTLVDTQSSADYLFEQSKIYQSRFNYPQTEFGQKLKQTAELITADTDTRIFYLSLTGFDTHARQKGVQDRLLQQYADGVRAFVSDLQQNDLLKDTLIMTFSEFGRRVAQNASGGTDHGAANNLFLIGGQLKKTGFYNAGPRLDQLTEGDLSYEVDFRSVYSTILEGWLDAQAPEILGGQFQTLQLI